MDIIPVIDLLQGQVVRARRGERDRYRPIVSSLCGTSAIEDIVQSLFGLYPFKKLYIADLDAITGQGDHAASIRHIRQCYPQLEIWLDGGFTAKEQLSSWHALGVQCVIASERLQNQAHYQELAGATPDARLSLDFSGDRFIGPPTLLQFTDEWPRHIICMTLERVGSDAGPDLDKLQRLMTLYPSGHWYAAGGVRSLDDLISLREAGLSGALVASALHDGKLLRHHLETFLQ